MQSTAIALVRHPLTQFGYENTPADTDVWLLCHPTKSQISHTYAGADPSHVRIYSHYETNDLVDYDAASIIESSDCRGIIALSEVDMLRAAQLRTRYDLPGLKYDTARLFRDKALMKETLREAGFRVPDFRTVDNGLDLMAAAQTYGYPFVLKPRMGGGSIGATVIRDAEDLRRHLSEGLRPNFYTPACLEAEEFVSGDLYHVDGLVIDGRVQLDSVSRYRSDILDFSTAVSTRMIDQTSTLAGQLTTFTHGVIAELGLLQPDIHSYFHCEVFHGADGLVLCEVAARPGGLGIVDQVDAHFGVNTFELLLAATLGRRLPTPRLAENRTLVGWVGIPKSCDPQVVRAHVPEANLVGERMHRTAMVGRQTSSVDLDGFVLMRADTEEELDGLLRSGVERVAAAVRPDVDPTQQSVPA
ncbi:acetyl-CoA carboxylase biotin carboxylase subunit family protein [Streptomyces sp. NPDC048436]|uniref:ATP-grasp domain-containing protein n=1 Tax=Streptomyces sp. NPDC048436 TaxID=3365550 RepID=UPI00371F0D4C